MNRLVRLFLVTLFSLNIVICEGVRGRKETEGRAEQKGKDDGEGTYNPKSAWMFVDSRRRVLPDIDVEAHFASVENHILSDIHNYHMADQQMRQAGRAEEPEYGDEDNWEEEHMDQYVISRFTPERASWRSEDVASDGDEPDDLTEYWWDRQDEDVAQARVGVGQSEDYLDSQTVGDSPYAETVNTVQSVEVAERQFTTVGLPPSTQATTGWAQTFVNGSAVALLAFLFLLNLTQDVIAQITGGRKRKRKRNAYMRISEQEEERVLNALNMDSQ